MSLILEALTRSQRERLDPQSVPGLTSDVYVEPHEAGARWLRWLPWLALLVALLGIGVLMFDRGQSGRAPVREAVTAPLPSPARPPVTPEPVHVAPPQTAAPVPAPRSAPDSAPRASAPTTAAEPRSNADSERVNALYERSAATEREPQVAVTPTPRKPPIPAATPPAEKETAIDIEQVLAQAEVEVANARLKEHSAPFLSSLSQHLKDDIPSILYSQHDYNSSENQSTVVLNGTTLKAGANVGGGVRLDEILRDSIVLSFRGEQFRLRALNSWVNL